MQTAETLLAISNQRIGPLESRMTRKCPVRFGGGRMEKDAAGYPSRLTHTGSRTPASDGTSPAAYPTRIVGSLKPFRWNPAGNQSRPVEPDQQPEASLAWGRVTSTAKRRQRDQKPCDLAPKLPLL